MYDTVKPSRSIPANPDNLPRLWKKTPNTCYFYKIVFNDRSSGLFSLLHLLEFNIFQIQCFCAKAAFLCKFSTITVYTPKIYQKSFLSPNSSTKMESVIFPQGFSIEILSNCKSFSFQGKKYSRARCQVGERASVLIRDSIGSLYLLSLILRFLLVFTSLGGDFAGTVASVIHATKFHEPTLSPSEILSINESFRGKRHLPTVSTPLALLASPFFSFNTLSMDS